MFAPFDEFLESIATDPALAPWLLTLPADLDAFARSPAGREFRRFEKVVARAAGFAAAAPVLDAPRVAFGSAADATPGQRRMLRSLIRKLMPWRKGPYAFFGENIDAEWRSFMKWDRLLPGITPLAGRSALDVGCGNGYHMWRMLGAGAARVTGIDPCPLFAAQFELFRRAAPPEIRRRIALLPLGIERMPELGAFDTVFSMGVLSHRRAPADHLTRLLRLLAPGGELVLETLVIEGDERTVLVPADRYAKMPNVWYIPSAASLENLLNRCGFIDVKLINVCVTTPEEQRRTELMTDESLGDFLDPADPSRTVEGYPAPARAVFTAKRKK